MQGKKILIAEDESRMRKLIADFLKKENCLVVEAENGKDALEKFEQEKNIDLVILDVMMPEYDGWTVCRMIRKNAKIPIIMLTARGEESDEIFGFDLGADEYITKPFSPQILIARIKALFRRIENTKQNKKIYGGIEINIDKHTVCVDKKRVEFSPKEFELLGYLAENAGIVLSREQILNAVWDFDYYGDSRTVDTHIKKIRLKLEQKGEYIKTVRGYGYRFEVDK